MRSAEDAGIDPGALERFIEEQIYTLPGIDHHREAFSVVLTGSRAIGTFSPESDVDVDVLCPRADYEIVQHAACDRGLIKSDTSFFRVCDADLRDRYFPQTSGLPHFSLTPLDIVKQQFRQFLDIPIWVWTNARIIADPGQQFAGLVQAFTGYPRDVLVSKVKRHWLLVWHWAITQAGEQHPLSAASSILNAVNEMLKVFFLVENRPYPYTKQLALLAETTRLGKISMPYLQDVIDLVVGISLPRADPKERIERAGGMLCGSDDHPRLRALEREWADAIVATGVARDWVESDMHNIHELWNSDAGCTD